MDIVRSLNLKSVDGPTHLRGHTDTVLSSGFILDSNNLPLPVPSVATYVTLTLTHKMLLPLHLYIATTINQTSTEELLTNFNNTCNVVLNSIAPVKIWKVKSTHSMPWLNNYTREIKRKCRQAERKWKKDHRLVSFQIMIELTYTYQQFVKEARSSYFSNIISTNLHNPRILCKTIKSVINPPPSQQTEATPLICEQILSFFKTPYWSCHRWPCFSTLKPLCLAQ